MGCAQPGARHISRIMEVIQVKKEEWRPILEACGFKIRQDGLICSSVQLATDSPHHLIPIKCMYCRSVLHLRNINYLQSDKAVCKDMLCTIMLVNEDGEEWSNL